MITNNNRSYSTSSSHSKPNSRKAITMKPKTYKAIQATRDHAMTKYVASLRKTMRQQLEPYTRRFCTMTVDQVFSWALNNGFGVHDPTNVMVRPGGWSNVGERYAYYKGSLPILAVCHADTVLESPDLYSYDKRTKTVYSPELDDRLGLACLVMLRQWFDFSILICDHEECGSSTAGIFASHVENSKNRDYYIPNWSFELDRRGTDVVSYDYTSTVWDGLLSQGFGVVGQGSFSDVCKLESMERKAFNLAIGYYMEHTKKCHAKLGETLEQLVNLIEFMISYSGTVFEHEERFRTYKGGWDDEYRYLGQYGGSYRKSKSKSETTTTKKPSKGPGVSNGPKIITPSKKVVKPVKVIDLVDETYNQDGVDSFYDEIDSDSLIGPASKATCESCECVIEPGSEMAWNGFTLCEDCGEYMNAAIPADNTETTKQVCDYLGRDKRHNS